MSDKEYSVVATVGIYDGDSNGINDVTKRFSIDLESFGVRKGLELTSQEIKEGGFSRVSSLLKMMKRPSPMTLLLNPVNRQKARFAELRRKKLKVDLNFVIFSNRNNPRTVPLLTMDNVHIMNIIPETVSENGSPTKYERIEAHFSKLDVSWV